MCPAEHAPATPWGAVVLAGGTAARMGGVDKASIELGGRSLLTWALDAVAEADEVVVVGDPVPTERPVTFTREDPSYGGPAAAVLAGVDAFARRPGYVAIIAVDMPRLTRQTLARLRGAAATEPQAEGAVLVGADGRRQLAMVLDVAALDRARPPSGDEFGLPLHKLLGSLALIGVAAESDEGRDVDGWGDLRDLGGSAP